MKPCSLPYILPIITPNVDWQTWINESYRLIGRSPTASVDATLTMAVGDPLSFIASLGEFQHKNTDPWAFVRSGGSVFLHLQTTYLIEADAEILQSLLEAALPNIVITKTDRLNVFVMSATLHAWRLAVLDACRKESSNYLRLFYNCMHLMLERQGFAELWRYCSKQMLEDGTYTLSKG